VPTVRGHLLSPLTPMARQGMCAVALAVALISPACSRTDAAVAGADQVNAGCTWKLVRADPVENTTLIGVDGVASNDVWAVGDNGLYPMLEHWDGTVWTATTQPGVGHNLHAVATLSASDAWAVGYRTVQGGIPATLVEHYDGVAWSRVMAPSPFSYDYLYGIAAISSTDIWAGGNMTAPDNSVQPLFLHYDGVAWNWVTAPVLHSGGVIMSMAASSTSDVWAVGYQDTGVNFDPQPLIEHWDGTTWQEIPSARVPTDQVSSLLTITAPGADDAWSFGYAGQPIGNLNEHWDGTAWKLVRPPHSGEDAGLLCSIAG